MKRKAEEESGDAKETKKQATRGAPRDVDVKSFFREGLWHLGDQKKQYAESQP